MRIKLRIALFVFVVGLAGAAAGQAPGDRPLDQPSRDEAGPRRDGRRDDDPPPPPPPKQKGKELFERDFPGPRDGRPGGDKNGPPKGKAGSGNRRPGEESFYEMNIRVNSEGLIRGHDRNGDGQLDRSEWTHIQHAENLDTDGDGVITLKELMDAPQGPRPFFPDARNANPGANGKIPGGFGGARGFGGPIPGPGGIIQASGMPRGEYVPGLGGKMMWRSYTGEGPPGDLEMHNVLAEDAEMERKTHEMAMRVRESRGEERTKLKAELSDIVNKHFDVRQKRRELQLKRMENELQRLREAISSRNKSRESIVTSHMKELIGEERDLEF